MGRRKKNFAAADHTAADDPKAPGQLNLSFETADDLLRQINDLEQQMADIRTELANTYKSFEKAGGDRKMLKVANRMAKQDPAKTLSEKRHLDQYYDWFVRKKVNSYARAEANQPEA